MTPHEVRQRIEDGLNQTQQNPSTQCTVAEYSGGSDHYRVQIISPVFEGLSTIARHRLVMKLFDAEIASGEVHALSIQAKTPQEITPQENI
jgi:stress-induced morphogen